jgi:hemolysin III
VHACAIALAATGAVALLHVTHYGSDRQCVGVLTYAGSLVVMFSLSAAYNLWPIGRSKWVLRRLDHAAICVFTAVSATPFLARMAGAEGSALLGIVWGGALAGALF